MDTKESCPVESLKMNIEIYKARQESIEAINSVIQDSKSFWHYPKSYLEKALPLLMVDADYLNANISFEIRIKKELVGFFAFSLKGTERHLDHLWIQPSHIKMGIGREVMLFSDVLAKKFNWPEVFTYPDPPAETFYLKSGFVDTGSRIPSRIEGGPQFSIFKKVYSSSDFEVK